jgi:hypothetical protein
MARLKKDETYIDQVLSKGSLRARAMASKTMKDVKGILGFIQ